VLGLRDLPGPTDWHPHGAPVFRPGTTDADVVVLQDVFTSALESETVAAAVRLIERLGWTVAVAEFIPSGKFDHVSGRRAAFRTAARRQRRLVRSIVDQGALPVAIEPATTLLHDFEYTAVLADQPTGDVIGLSSLLIERASQLEVLAPSHVRLLSHCTETARRSRWTTEWTRLLEAAGHRVEAPQTGCCGMAGLFGHEPAHQDVSRTLWDMSWGPATAVEGQQVVLAATGFSCRSQTRRFGSSHIVHPVHLLSVPDHAPVHDA
jgi:Fe-S oxidoreductase